MTALFVKEIKNFLHSLTGYIAIIAFLLINGLFLWILPGNYNILDGGYATLYGFFAISPYVFLFLIAAITMRLFAEEKKTQTIEVLFAKPLTDWEIIFAKYLAALFLVFLSLLPALIYFFSIYQLGLPKGNIDNGAIWGSYIGLFFLSAAFAAIGIFTSSLTDNQILSFILAMALCAFLYIGFEFIYSLQFFSSQDLLIRTLGIHTHYTSISRGVIDSRDIIYFFSLIALFLLCTKFVLQSRKW